METIVSVIASRKESGKYNQGNKVRTGGECMMGGFDALGDYVGERG